MYAFRKDKHNPIVIKDEPVQKEPELKKEPPMREGYYTTTPWLKPGQDGYTIAPTQETKDKADAESYKLGKSNIDTSFNASLPNNYGFSWDKVGKGFDSMMKDLGLDPNVVKEKGKEGAMILLKKAVGLSEGGKVTDEMKEGYGQLRENPNHTQEARLREVLHKTYGWTGLFSHGGKVRRELRADSFH